MKPRTAITLTDAEVAARYLNGSTGTASYARVLAIRQQLVTIGDESDVLQKGRRELERKVTAGEKTKLSKLGAQHKRQFAALEKALDALNTALSRYTFHPRVSYTIFTDTHAAGLSPVTRKGWFELRGKELSSSGHTVQEWTLSEADAVMSLTRLFLSGELHRVRLCAHCKERWFVQAKSHYRFCGNECREAFYVEAPGYHQRKVEIQRAYRARRKRRARSLY